MIGQQLVCQMLEDLHLPAFVQSGHELEIWAGKSRSRDNCFLNQEEHIL